MGKKFIWHEGPMDAGKTLQLMVARHNYVKKNKPVVLAKPDRDKKGDDTIETRAKGFDPVTVDVLFDDEDNAYEQLLRGIGSNSLREAGIKCVFLDEVQFMTPPQVDDIYWNVTKGEKIAVMAYGLKTDFIGEPFPGSVRAHARANKVRELVTVCGCDRDIKAEHNTRFIDGVSVFVGDQESIDGIDSTYESLCAYCYADELYGAIKEGRPISPTLKPTVDAILRFAGVLTTTDKNEA